MDLVYLDTCSLKRPFDDQRKPRVREEAAAVAAIMGRTVVIAPGGLPAGGES